MFVILPPALTEELERHFEVFVKEKLDEDSLVVRIVTS